MTHKYEVVVGLEIHAQLNTLSKIFSSDSTAFGQAPNTQVSVITLAHPGTLPKLNKEAAELAIKMGLACNSQISRTNVFDRKNYFYPDLPKGYQITQDKTPICIGGSVKFRLKNGQEGEVELHHIHLEEDAGKSIHLEGEPESCIDLNRAGMPLIEIVSNPCIRSGEEAAAYLGAVRQLVRYLGISDGNMEEGSLRADANISVRLKGEKKLGNKVEVKNMNSMKHVQKAVEYEFERQTAMLERGETIVSETRTFNVNDGSTAAMRLKETLNDYRYFPDPDLPPMLVSEAMLEGIKQRMPSLPWELYERFTQQYGLPAYDAGVLTEEKDMADFFLQIVSHTAHYKAASNWTMGPVKSYLNDNGMSQFPISPKALASLIELIEQGKISHTTASQQLFPQWLQKPESSAEALAQANGWLQESGSDFILPIVKEVLATMPDKVHAYKHQGKKNLLGLFMGEVMKKGQGKIDPKKAAELIKAELGG